MNGCIHVCVRMPVLLVRRYNLNIRAADGGGVLMECD